MPLFDRYIAVDWSANNGPKLGKDSIWSCLGTSATVDLSAKNHRTRHAVDEWLIEQLTTAVRANERVLVGLDFPYGYPAGFAAALGVEGEPWRGTWSYLAHHIVDDESNVSNRFEVASGVNARLGRHAPFWGRPANRTLSHLPAKKHVSYFGSKEPGGLSEWRGIEELLRRSGEKPHSVWKLMYAGSVGSQSLLGIPVLHRLRIHEGLRNVSHVWPFEVRIPTLPVGQPAVVHAEIWPSIVPFDHEEGSCRDEQQVRAVVECWRRLDRKDELGEWFATPEDDRVRREEGWVLGVPAALSLDGAIEVESKLQHGRGLRFVGGSTHVKPAVEQGDRQPCLCGCGNYPRGKRSRFILGHDQRRDSVTDRPFNVH